MRIQIEKSRGLAAFAAVLALGLAPLARAAEPGSGAAAVPGGGAGGEPAPVPAVAQVPVPEIAQRTDKLRESLRETLARAQPEPAVMTIAEQLAEFIRAVQESAPEVQTRLAESPGLERLTDLERDWTARSQQLGGWRDALTKRASRLESDVGDLEARREVWYATLTRARETQAPQQVQDNVQQNVAEINRALGEVQARRAVLLTLLYQLSQQQAAVTDVIAAVQMARQQVRASLLDPDAPVLWAARGPGAEGGAPGLAPIVGALRADARVVTDFLRDQPRSFLPLAAFFAATLAAALVLRGRLRRRSADAGRLAGSAAIFERPFSVSFLATFVAGAAAFPLAPARVTDLVGVLVVVPVLRLLQPLVHERFRRLLWTLAGFYLLDRVRDVLDAIPWVERSVFFAETLAAAAVLGWLLRPRRLASVPLDGTPPVALGVGLRLALALLVVASLANLFGYLDFARLLGEGALTSFYLGIVVFAAYRVASTVLVVLLGTRRVGQLGVVGAHGAVILRAGRAVFALAALAAWGWFSLAAFEVADSVAAGLAALLATPLGFGATAVTLGDVLAFALTVGAAFVVARVVRAVLRDDVLPRVALQRGVGNAVSTVLHYALLLGGFLLALAAAGVDFNRFALLAGAFGVGIGFGLQNVVNNFVSGLILLFERPVQVGDTIEVGGLMGDVKRIGIRSSTVRTFQGAEVIVPNGNLISDQVVNWTLSDRQRRVEVTVGVAYGTDVRRVLEILTRVAGEDPRALRTPAPLALFRGFGDSSLDFELRVWIGDFTHFLQVGSDLAVAVSEAFAAEGISIPFPQRDLHVRSVDAAAAGALRGEAA